MRWELENNVQNVSTDALYKYDAAEQQAIQAQKPWTKDPHFFKQCVLPLPRLLPLLSCVQAWGCRHGCDCSSRQGTAGERAV